MCSSISHQWSECSLIHGWSHCRRRSDSGSDSTTMYSSRGYLSGFPGGFALPFILAGAIVGGISSVALRMRSRDFKNTKFIIQEISTISTHSDSDLFLILPRSGCHSYNGVLVYWMISLPRRISCGREGYLPGLVPSVPGSRQHTKGIARSAVVSLMGISQQLFSTNPTIALELIVMSQRSRDFVVKPLSRLTSVAVSLLALTSAVWAGPGSLRMGAGISKWKIPSGHGI